MRKAIYLIYPTIIGLTLLVGFFLYQPNPSSNALERLEDFAYPSMISGSKDASISIIEILDYDCPYCHVMHKTLVEAQKKNSDIRLTYLPIPVMGSESSVVKVNSAWTMAAFDKFLTAHEKFFDEKEQYSKADIPSLAKDFNVSPEEYKEQYYSPNQLSHLIQLSQVAEDTFGTIKTPSLLINGEVYIPEDIIPSTEEFLDLLKDYE